MRTPAFLRLKNTWGLQTKKLIVDVDQERALRAGVTSNDVAYSLRAGLTGIEMTQYREGDQLIPVTLRSVASDRQDISKLDGLSIYSQTSGRPVPLKQVADIRLTFEPGIIERRDRERTLTLKAQLKDGVTATEVNADLLPWLASASEEWRAGYNYEVGGESETSSDANASIAAKLPLAIMVVVLLLVFQFNSVRRPIIILFTIPLGLIGVTFGLLVANSTMGFLHAARHHRCYPASSLTTRSSSSTASRSRSKSWVSPPFEAVVARLLAAFATHHADHRDHRTGHDAAVVGWHGHVRAYGGYDDLWVVVCDDANAARRAGFVFSVLPGKAF